MDKEIRDVIESLDKDEFLLPIGFLDEDGVRHRVVKLRPMTGETEEQIADPKLKDNGGKIITALLASTVESIGTLPKVTKNMIREMTAIDRDFLLIKNRQVSLGDEVEYIDTCPHCREKNDITVNLEDLEVKYSTEMDKELKFELPVGYTDGNGVVHKDVTIILPTGAIQERVFQTVRSNPATATTLMLQLITIKLGTLDFIRPDVFKKMTKKDRDFITKKLNEVEAGIDYGKEVYCSECGTEFRTNIPVQVLMGE